MSGPFFLYKLTMQKYEHFKNVSAANMLLFIFFLSYQDVYIANIAGYGDSHSSLSTWEAETGRLS